MERFNPFYTKTDAFQQNFHCCAESCLNEWKNMFLWKMFVPKYKIFIKVTPKMASDL